MTIIRRTLIIIVAATFCAGALAFAQAQPGQERLTVAFSDPGRPGKLEMHSMGGTITIRGANRKDVLIVASSKQQETSRGPRRDSDTSTTGLRRLPQPGGFEVEESNNVLEISAGPMRGHDFEIEVPTRTNLEVSLVNGGAMNIANVEGDIEVDNVNGSVTLTSVGGTVVANSVNGSVKAVLTRVTADKPMAFTTLNGAVDVTLPATIKATFKLRSDMGDIYTDFDLALKTLASPTPEPSRGRGPQRIEINRSLFGTANGGGPEIELRSFNGNIYLRKGQ